MQPDVALIIEQEGKQTIEIIRDMIDKIVIVDDEEFINTKYHFIER